MKKEVIFVLIDEFADWESAFLTSALKQGIGASKPVYVPKVLSVDGTTIHSMGGFSVQPDYSINTLPENYAALVLIGGTDWQSEAAARLVPLVRHAVERGIILAAICNASLFLGQHGFLNHVRHTSNTLEWLKDWGGVNYCGEEFYLAQQAVSDQRIVTANGTGYLEFAREVLLQLDVAAPDEIETYYQQHKVGYYQWLINSGHGHWI